MRLAVPLVFVLAACGAESSRGDAPTDAGASYPPQDFGCHIDCFPGSRCDPDSGIATASLGAPIDCRPFAPGICDALTVHCEFGCRRDGVLESHGPGWRDPTSLCEASAPRVAGDACGVNTECTPSDSRLACDAGACAPYSVPAPPGWLAECDLAVGRYSHDLYTLVPDPGCASGVCLAAWSSECVTGSCGARCADDWDCPDGSRCRDVATDVPDAGARACAPDVPVACR